MPKIIKKRELTQTDYKEIFENYFLMPKDVSVEASEKHHIDFFYGVDERSRYIWVAVSKVELQVELLHRRGHNINPVMVQKGDKVVPEYHLKKGYREQISEYYNEFLKTFNIQEIKMTHGEKYASGVATVYQVEWSLLDALSKKLLTRRKWDASCKDELSETDKIDSITYFPLRKFPHFIPENSKLPRIYNNFTTSDKDGKSMSLCDAARELYRASRRMQLLEVNIRACIPQCIAILSHCEGILEAIRQGSFYELDIKDEEKKISLEQAYRKSFFICLSEKFDDVDIKSKWEVIERNLLHRFGEMETKRFMKTLKEYKRSTDLYRFEEPMRDFCRKNTYCTVNLHDRVVFAGWTEKGIRQLTDELDAGGVIYSVREITPGKERELTEAWMKREAIENIEPSSAMKD